MVQEQKCGSAGSLSWQSYCWTIFRELFPAALQKPALIIAKNGCRQEIAVVPMLWAQTIQDFQMKCCNFSDNIFNFYARAGA